MAREFREKFVGLGPRPASAVRAFLKIVADDDLDVSLWWREPRRPTINAALTAAETGSSSRSPRTTGSMTTNSRLAASTQSVIGTRP